MNPSLYRSQTDSARMRSGGAIGSPAPGLPRHHSAMPSYGERRYDSSYRGSRSASESVETYSSSPSSTSEDFGSRPSVYSYDSRYMPESEAVPSTPPLFAQLFPSTRRLIIKHDDSTPDGNMNLRIDCNTNHKSEPAKHVTLFHLKMTDLKRREMSLRRYGRECGREVVNYRRKFAQSAADRPTLQRSGSNFLNTFRGKGSKEKVLQRQDSGYESDDASSDGETKSTSPTSGSIDKVKAEIPTNTLLLEFSNYAHVQVKRRGGKGAKKYEFEYWGKSYAWKRKITHYGHDESCSYQLVNLATNNVVAEIRPDNLSPSEVAEEERKGGFVPPCTMWLCDDNTDSVVGSMCDLADVVVSTGIGALVDDCIKRRFSKTKKVVKLVIPTMRGNSVKMQMEYVGPKRLINQVFSKSATTSPTKTTASSSPSNSRPNTPSRTNSARSTTSPAYHDRMASRPTPLRATTRV